MLSRAAFRIRALLSEDIPVVFFFFNRTFAEKKQHIFKLWVLSRFRRAFVHTKVPIVFWEPHGGVGCGVMLRFLAPANMVDATPDVGWGKNRTGSHGRRDVYDVFHGYLVYHVYLEYPLYLVYPVFPVNRVYHVYRVFHVYHVCDVYHVYRCCKDLFPAAIMIDVLVISHPTVDAFVGLASLPWLAITLQSFVIENSQSNNPQCLEFRVLCLLLDCLHLFLPGVKKTWCIEN